MSDYLTITQVSERLSHSFSVIHYLHEKEKLIFYGVWECVYFKRSDIESALIPFGKNKGGNNG